MFYQKSVHVKDEATEVRKDERGAPFLYYHQLPDGRMAPVEIGGLVDLALSELGACLVDVSDEGIPGFASSLN